MASSFRSAALLSKDSPYSLVLILMTIFPFVLTMLIAFLLFRNTQWFVEILTSSMVWDNKGEILAQGLLRLMLAVFGIAFLVEGLLRASAFPNLIQTYMQLEDLKIIDMLRNSLLLEPVFLGVKIVIALYLIFWSGGLVRWWHRRIQGQLSTPD